MLIYNTENWKEAQIDFHESFRNYDEAGSLQRIQVLKYLVLTTMLMQSDINPFDSQETKPYKNDPRISAMTDLVDAFQRDDIHGYETILQKNKDLLEDPFIAENIDEVSFLYFYHDSCTCETGATCFQAGSEAVIGLQIRVLT